MATLGATAALAAASAPAGSPERWLRRQSSMPIVAVTSRPSTKARADGTVGRRRERAAAAGGADAGEAVGVDAVP
jgi:hypothetical protein